MDWVRGEKLGFGSFASVNLALPRRQSSQISPLMAVKSCGASCATSLMNEKLVLDELKDCPEIIRCFGESFSYENGEKLYNVLLEYASGGNLADKLKNSCDQRLPGISNGGVKIADFGLAKRAGGKEEGVSRNELRGTPLYMSPEMGEGKDFLEKCFVKDPSKRWTADMLLNHPFVADQDFGDTENITSTSPRCPFDFPDWASSVTSFSSPEYSPESNFWFSGNSNLPSESWSISPDERLQGLVSHQDPDWSVSDDWIPVR
ncbi:mitogen-activated protein kinase kinase kinase 19 [Abeliophyllum distichum]|uniref:Mitogen-activated protein kinase kinase kinase 19 n=1 Tax=Abeliophyllum distichum TaxID=126358 RepID=A0ABD1SG07_9LAMI